MSRAAVIPFARMVAPIRIPGVGNKLALENLEFCAGPQGARTGRPISDLRPTPALICHALA
jgi:hypothetical protein